MLASFKNSGNQGLSYISAHALLICTEIQRCHHPCKRNIHLIRPVKQFPIQYLHQSKFPWKLSEILPDEGLNKKLMSPTVHNLWFTHCFQQTMCFVYSLIQYCTQSYSSHFKNRYVQLFCKKNLAVCQEFEEEGIHFLNWMTATQFF